MQSYKHFTFNDRESIQVMINEGKKPSEIARALGRHRSSIIREIKRNQNKDKSYNSWRATVCYIVRRKSCVRKLRLSDQIAFSFVQKCLEQYWSPEIISHRWLIEHPDDPIGHTTIYRAIHRKQIIGCEPKTHLRRRGKRKNKHNTQAINPVHTIHQRPEIVETRGRLGDMEGDTVYGAIGKGCVLTVVDRKSRMFYATLCASRDSSLIPEAFAKAFNGEKIESLTLDRGSEFAKFAEIEEKFKTTVYFADPHSPWQRPSNENINGLLRFFYPKGVDFTAVQEEEFKHVVALINNRPRKCLDWLSPVEFISKRCT